MFVCLFLELRLFPHNCRESGQSGFDHLQMMIPSQWTWTDSDFPKRIVVRGVHTVGFVRHNMDASFPYYVLFFLIPTGL